MENKWEPSRYYWCSKCGHHGDLGKVYKNKKKCEECDYDDLVTFSYTEIQEDEDLWTNRFKRKK